MRALSLFDAAFIAAESRETPLHVGSLLLFRPPPGSGPEQLAELYRSCVDVKELRAPFDHKLVYPLSRLGLPHWDRDPDFDVEYHVRRSAVPSPGRYRELFVLAARLHGALLDRSRPLWELHLIEGLRSGQFAVYAKLHHAQIDGMAGMRLLRSWLTEDPGERDTPHFWSVEGRGWKRPKPAAAPVGFDLASAVEQARARAALLPNVTRAVRQALGSYSRPAEGRMALPFEAPRSVFNTRVTAARRFVAQSYSLERVNRVKRAFDATVNDVVLAMCASALRRYLDELGGGVPARPLTAMAPVSIRPRDSDDFGNAASAVLVNLATHLPDPVARLRAIQSSIRDGRALLSELSFDEVVVYTAIMSTPVLGPSAFGLGGVVPPTNIVVSNVPGPPNPLYWSGARLDGMYPVSAVFHGMAVNITVTSYAGSLDFGIVACRHSVQRVQRLIDFLEDGLAELEEAAGVSCPEVAQQA
ncbi:MAG: wax ester/triacylglycerol synthase family O-acyltransferase [Polyangiaceae bacterium]|nr:wax ester/triacylglycerol synthase family O-acyltransferase [Polyangiaceae bacterium]